MLYRVVVDKIVTRFLVESLDFFFTFSGNVEVYETKISFALRQFKFSNAKIFLLKI